MSQTFREVFCVNKSSYKTKPFDSDGNMLDSNGNYVEDNDSITSSWYYQTLASQSSSSSDGSGSGNSGSDSSDASDDNSEG